jgi:hypothetical protein
MIDYQSYGCNADEWLHCLKPYQARSLRQILSESEGDEDAARRWLSITGSSNIAAFGGQGSSEPFWERFKTEFHRFVCDGEAYTDLKEKLRDQGVITRELLISGIAAGIASTLGFAAALLAPAVALMLCAVARIGKNAYCELS